MTQDTFGAGLSRRDILKLGTAAAGLASPLVAAIPSRAADLSFPPEAGAALRVLRWKRFVQGDEDLWMANTRKFTEVTGVAVRVDHESFEDVRPKAAVAAQVGSGPDIVLGFYDDPYLYPDKLLDLTDLATYLGGKYGGWYPVAERYGSESGRWIGLPFGAAGGCAVFRISWMQEAGFETFPVDTDGLLKLCQAMYKNGHPSGLSLGNAVGDGTNWCHWLLWSHGGRVVDDDNNVVLDSPETLAALEYGRALYATFIRGTLSWLDPSNNKTFLAGDIGFTLNGISIYYAAKNDPTMAALAADIGHANLPIGPVGHPTELGGLVTQAMVFRHSKYPNACKEYLRFMCEAEQYVPWQQASIGFVTQALKAYESNPVWTVDPKHTPYRDTMARALWSGYSGRMGASSAAAMADYIVVNMVAEAASGDREPKDAAKRAQKRAERVYRA